ncbi:KANTR integral membrane protein-like [Neofelis nebulosa]|uniref:KANTR integral membrane protein-like n=1 Tax=Neofelis nebulosa TaxID=61452 RepID=UPI00272D2D8B|nr:KANTR integral membrane protein-like [Neofelis nebulosa]
MGLRLPKGSVVISPLSVLILVIYLTYSFFFMISLVRGLSIVLVFSKNETLVLLILSNVCLIFILLISSLCYFLPSTNFWLFFFCF